MRTGARLPIKARCQGLRRLKRSLNCQDSRRTKRIRIPAELRKSLKRSSGPRTEPYGGTAVIKAEEEVRGHVSSRTVARLLKKARY